MKTYQEFLDNQGEKKWQKYWDDNKTFEVIEDTTKEKFYSLIEFPYPSGAGLHVGHPRSITAMDVVSRKKRMEGFNVLYPIGFDAFGLPTENYAIKTGRPPAEVTAENIATFTRQLKALGYSFDWSRAVDTTDPQYFKWTQWLFLQFHKHGLAYKKNMPINWCLSCKIGLANEEVVDGKCERCGGDVEKRDKEQWMLAITKYADSLLEGLEDVDYIPQARTQQENWIGRSEGAEVKFQVVCHPELDSGSVEEKNSDTGKMLNQVQHDSAIKVFTTRPDTLFGATYMVLAPEHPLISNLKLEISNLDEVTEYVKKSALKSDLERTELQKEKTGVEIKGIKAINPVNNEEIPVFVADYVLASYGTGAIMAVPAHDERDYEFAVARNKKQGTGDKTVIEIRPVVLKQDEKSRSFVMGISEENIKKFDGEIIEKTESNFFKIKIPFEQLENYKEFIRENMEPGFWNEFSIQNGFYFIFKHKDGRLEEMKLDKNTNDLIDEYGQTFNNEKINENPENVYSWLAKNDFYKDILIHSDPGVAINSDFLNGLETQEAKEKMIEWLEEKGVGKRKVQFKLRDWVFSRQRYWGEPIPLVHCDACENKKYTYVLIHGFTGSSTANFFPWLKKSLEEKGHNVYCPDLPNSDEPTIDEQVQYILDNTSFEENTIIMAHSLGSAVTYKLLEKLNTKVKKVILVDGFIRPEFNDHTRPNVEKSCDWKFDFESIKEKAKQFVVLADDQYPIIPQEQIKEMRELFDAELNIVKTEDEHFCADEEPEILASALPTAWIPLPEDQLPLTLPEVEKYEPTDTGESPLAAMEDWVNTTCPQCSGPARRETDTMPNWAGSSWYFLRYMDPHNDSVFASKEALDYWAPVDWYNGGMEHTVLHLLYSRFWNQFLYDIGLVPTKEPYKKRTSHGMILAEDGEKMSKSRGNVINPDDMIEQFGTDAFRMYIMFMGPFDQAVAWNTDGVKGVKRFLDRVWNLYEKINDTKQNGKTYMNGVESPLPSFDFVLHNLIKKITDDIENMRFNTAVAQLMILTNEMTYPSVRISSADYEILIKLLSPFAPHIAEELWGKLGHDTSIAYEPWPKYDESKMVEDEITLAVQVNGKLRATITVPADISEDDVKAEALKHENVVKWVDGKEPKKVIFVKGKMISIVV